MAVVSTLSNHYKYQLMDKQIDLSADTLKIMLMNNVFAFDKDAQPTKTEIDALGQEVTGANGYTTGGATIANPVLTEDDVNDRGLFSCDDVSWTASGGDIGPTGAAIIYDDTSADKTVVGCIDYGEDYTIPTGSSFWIKDIEIETT